MAPGRPHQTGACTTKFFYMNFFITVIGWIVWNVAEMEIRRQQFANDNDPSTVFNFGVYRREKIISWIGSFFMCIILLWVGKAQLNLDPLGSLVGHELKWNDLYLLGAGAAWEVLIFVIGQIHRYIKKKSQE